MREKHLQAFLDRHHLGSCKRMALAGDASSRRYERLQAERTSYILMDAPPPEAVDPFVSVAEILKERGYSPPEVIDADRSSGFLLLEDLGDGLLAKLIAAGAQEAPLYSLAVDFLIDLTRQPAPDSLPRFSGDYIGSQNEMFLDWYIPDQINGLLSGPDTTLFNEIWEELIPLIYISPDILLLRDFHAENLLYLRDREGLKALGLLDFQDAMQGPPAYDLVSLLQDARRDVSPSLEQSMLQRYLDEIQIEKGQFARSYAILGAHRAMRILGIFVRLAKEKGKPSYLEMVPRVKSHLQRNLAHPDLARLRSWMEKLLGKEGMAS